MGINESMSEGGAAGAITAPRRKSFTVLIAAHDPAERDALLLLLENMEVRVDAVDNGADAVDSLVHFPYDLVLLNSRMPRMDGFAVAREIRHIEGRKWHTPLVLLSEDIARDSEECRAAGMDGELAKPVDAEKLSAILEKWDVPVDPKALENLRALAQDTAPQFAEEVLQLFLSDSTVRIGELLEALQSRNGEALARAAHTLKGSSGNVGARGLQTLCARLERAGRTSALDSAGEIVADLRSEFDRVRAFLSRPSLI
jgi:two-component system, sensor histidine kinase and response regulator